MFLHNTDINFMFCTICSQFKIVKNVFAYGLSRFGHKDQNKKKLFFWCLELWPLTWLETVLRFDKNIQLCHTYSFWNAVSVSGLAAATAVPSTPQQESSLIHMDSNVYVIWHVLWKCAEMLLK